MFSKFSHIICQFLVFLTPLLFSTTLLAEITLDGRSYVNRPHIDALRGTVNLNFTYRGCDPSPSADKIKLEASPDCRDASAFDLMKNATTAATGRVGEIMTSYQEPEGTCLPSDTRTVQLQDDRSFVDLYNSFKARGCFPSHIVLTNQNSTSTQQISKSLRNRSLCDLPKTVIQKPGFPTEDPRFQMKADDEGFTMGGHNFRYNHDNNSWCLKQKGGEEKCGAWASPIPLYYKDSNNRIHVKATVSLNPGGQASVRALDRQFNSQAALHNAQRRNELTRNDQEKGRIDYSTWRSDSSGVVRSIVRSYKNDGPNATHERSLNFFARNVFGAAATHSWCPTDHCLAEPPKGINPELDSLSCSTQINRNSGTQSCFNECSDKPSFNTSNGGNLNACSSCVGITPGQCALKSQVSQTGQGGITIIRNNFTENENFSINPTSGEYRLKNNVDAGLASIYAQMIKKPMNPGCHQGISPAFNSVFDEPGRSVQSEEPHVPL